MTTILNQGQISWLVVRRDQGDCYWVAKARLADNPTEFVLGSGTTQHATEAQRDLATAVFEFVTKRRVPIKPSTPPTKSDRK